QTVISSINQNFLSASCPVDIDTGSFPLRIRVHHGGEQPGHSVHAHRRSQRAGRAGLFARTGRRAAKDVISDCLPADLPGSAGEDYEPAVDQQPGDAD
uniref:Clade I nitrous oxide reductase n=1 Tax=Macrostomum lignano TaxID=282301 RepID=A0A1I8G8Y3_9PLAT